MDLLQYNTHASERNTAEKLSNYYKAPSHPLQLCVPTLQGQLSTENNYSVHSDAFQPMIWLNSSKILWSDKKTK